MTRKWIHTDVKNRIGVHQHQAFAPSRHFFPFPGEFEASPRLADPKFHTLIRRVFSRALNRNFNSGRSCRLLVCSGEG